MNDIVLLSVFSLILLIVFIIIIIILANRTRSLTFSERIHPEECQMIHNAPGVSGFFVLFKCQQFEDCRVLPVDLVSARSFGR